jgi:hypothetical protein
MEEHPEFFFDESHFSEAGAREVARLILNERMRTVTSKDDDIQSLKATSMSATSR